MGYDNTTTDASPFGVPAVKSLLPALLLLPAVALAQPQPAAKPPALAELNKRAVDVLRDMHDLGRDFYNAGDAVGTLRVYQTALRTVSPFVAHHPAIQKAIADGLAEADKLDGDKAKAFRLHEVIEQVRTDLRAEAKKLEAEPKTPEPATPKDPPATPKDPTPAKVALAGVVTLKGKPLANGEVTLVSLNLPAPRVFTAKPDAAGKYEFVTLPPAEYAVIVTGPGVPTKYQTTDSSGLRATVKAAGATLDWNLQ